MTLNTAASKDQASRAAAPGPVRQLTQQAVDATAGKPTVADADAFSRARSRNRFAGVRTVQARRHTSDQTVSALQAPSSTRRHTAGDMASPPHFPSSFLAPVPEYLEIQATGAGNSSMLVQPAPEESRTGEQLRGDPELQQLAPGHSLDTVQQQPQPQTGVPGATIMSSNQSAPALAAPWSMDTHPSSSTYQTGYAAVTPPDISPVRETAIGPPDASQLDRLPPGESPGREEPVDGCAAEVIAAEVIGIPPGRMASPSREAATKGEPIEVQAKSDLHAVGACVPEPTLNQQPQLMRPVVAPPESMQALLDAIAASGNQLSEQMRYAAEEGCNH